MSPRFEPIYDTITRIPEGQVASYGQVASECGLPRRARLVARALAGLPEGSFVPWQRVVRADGHIAFAGEDPRHELQVELLRAEGVSVEEGRIDLRRYGWRTSSP